MKANSRIIPISDHHREPSRFNWEFAGFCLSAVFILAFFGFQFGRFFLRGLGL